jgi:hypothetical protein
MTNRIEFTQKVFIFEALLPFGDEFQCDYIRKYHSIHGIRTVEVSIPLEEWIELGGLPDGSIPAESYLFHALKASLKLAALMHKDSVTEVIRIPREKEARELWYSRKCFPSCEF